MEFLDELTEGLDRVLMVRGGGREVITIYSWHETLRLAGDIFSAIAMQEKNWRKSFYETRCKELGDTYGQSQF